MASPDGVRPIVIPEVGPERLSRLLALNNDHATELSWLTGDAFERLIRIAFAALCVGDADAFMLALDQDADYGSPNFIWFRQRYARFVYVDRIVVAPEARGRGIAQALYRSLFAAAARAGHVVIGCEVNAEPPNPASDAFHAKLGFAPVGLEAFAGYGKTVRYLVRGLED